MKRSSPLTNLPKQDPEMAFTNPMDIWSDINTCHQPQGIDLSFIDDSSSDTIDLTTDEVPEPVSDLASIFIDDESDDEFIDLSELKRYVHILRDEMIDRECENAELRQRVRKLEDMRVNGKFVK
ncbi:MAG: hypothetical protein [Cressdnaviricota sp.]|nr:MAG: hypothetical protein [Cressdnaviricota sp.]